MSSEEQFVEPHHQPVVEKQVRLPVGPLLRTPLHKALHADEVVLLGGCANGTRLEEREAGSARRTAVGSAEATVTLGRASPEVPCMKAIHARGCERHAIDMARDHEEDQDLQAQEGRR